MRTTQAYQIESEDGFGGVLNFHGSNRIIGHITIKTDRYDVTGELKSGREIVLSGQHFELSLNYQE